MVVVPLPAPIEIVVAAPARFRLVAPVLNIFALVSVVVISPPLTAIFPEVVISPFDPFTEKAVAVMSLPPRESAFTISGSERLIPFVIAPEADSMVMPFVSVVSVSLF
jgi:hypothetical protein